MNERLLTTDVVAEQPSKLGAGRYQQAVACLPHSPDAANSGEATPATPQSPAAAAVPDVTAVRAVVEEHFPDLWPAVDLGLAVCATLLLEKSANPVALIYVGGPSSSKTIVADMFADAQTVVRDGTETHPLIYLSDSFTPASFVSQAANREKKALDKIDLLPRIKHKVLVTPELAPTFRGKEEDLIGAFKIITRVLDGQGLKVDSGTHGQRGYRGDYLFAWLGCTTPFEDRVWRVMGQLGSRLFFLVMDDDAVEVTVEMLVESEGHGDYAFRLGSCKVAVDAFLTKLFDAYGGVRGVPWDSTRDPRDVIEWIARAAKCLAAMRSEPTKEAPAVYEGHGYTPARTEQPWRAHAVLRNLAMGHALVHGRTHLTDADLPPVVRVAVSSMPSECARVFTALVKAKAQELTVEEVKAALRVKSLDTARKVMRELDRRGLMEFDEKGVGKAGSLRFRPDWAWSTSADFRKLLLGSLEPVTGQEACATAEHVKNREVCAPAVPPDLVQRQKEEETKKEGRDTHNPQEMTGCSSAVEHAKPHPIKPEDADCVTR